MSEFNRGSSVSVKHENRSIKAYPMLETELDQVAETSESRSLFSMLSSVAISLFIGLLVPVMMPPAEISAQILGMMQAVCGLSLVSGVLLGTKACRDSAKLRRLIHEIKNREKLDA